MVVDCAALEKKAEELHEKGLVRPIEGSIVEVMKSFSQLVVSKMKPKGESLKVKANSEDNKYLFQL